MFLTRILRAGALARVPWDVLILLGGSFALAETIQASGLSKNIAASLSGVGALDPLVIMLLVSVTTVFLSAFTSNTATCSIMLVVVADLVKSGPLPYLAVVTLASSCDFMLPAGTPPNAIVFGTKYVRMSQMVRTGFVLDLAAALAVALWCFLAVPP
jgi:sodium-dependent dicarboxylate transporter 2/3/5